VGVDGVASHAMTYSALPEPMLARASRRCPLATTGFRAIVSTEDGFRVRSRRRFDTAAGDAQVPLHGRLRVFGHAQWSPSTLLCMRALPRT
jgi:hypothetical protein